MRTEHIVMDYCLTFEAAFHCGTGLRGGLIHRLTARDAHGYLYVPGSTLKGALRERCEQLARLWGLDANTPHLESGREAGLEPDIVTRTFGSRFQPGHLTFDDAQMVAEDQTLFEHRVESLKPQFRAWQTEKRTQVSLSRLTGTANSGMLYTSEYGLRDLHFVGRIAGILSGVPLLQQDLGSFSLVLLISGLLSLDRIGGNKSTGAGRFACEINHITVNQQPCTIEALVESLSDLEIYELALEEAAL